MRRPHACNTVVTQEAMSGHATNWHPGSNEIARIPLSSNPRSLASTQYKGDWEIGGALDPSPHRPSHPPSSRARFRRNHTRGPAVAGEENWNVSRKCALCCLGGRAPRGQQDNCKIFVHSTQRVAPEVALPQWCRCTFVCLMVTVRVMRHRAYLV